MKIAIFGAGAIGLFLGVRLHQAGADVSLIARGANFEALERNGATLKWAGETTTVRPFVTDDARRAGIQDYVFISIKAHTLPEVADDVAAMVGPETTLITAQNGVPYWYFHGLASPWRDRVIESVDPGGKLWRKLPPEQVIGSVLYPWAEISAPGIVEAAASNRFVLGEPDGTESSRIKELSGIMRAGKLDAPITRDIRTELWIKLWGNLSFNPISVLTGSTIDRLTQEPDVRAVARAMMVEAEQVANALGVNFGMNVDQRIAITKLGGARKTSTLQDFERGKSLEIDPLLGAIVELGELTGHELPFCRAVLGLVRERERVAQASARK